MQEPAPQAVLAPERAPGADTVRTPPGHGWRRLVFGERSISKVAALLPDGAAADAATLALQREAGLDRSQVRKLSPDDARASHRDLLARKLEPEERGIVHTLIRAHVSMGSVGLIAGIALYLALRAGGVAAIALAPWFSLLVLAGFGAVFGMLLGGLISLRPDHVPLITELRRGLEEDQWAVVAHPLDRSQADAAERCLAEGGAKVVRSL